MRNLKFGIYDHYLEILANLFDYNIIVRQRHIETRDIFNSRQTHHFIPPSLDHVILLTYKEPSMSL